MQLPEEMVAHIDSHAGRGGRSQYIRYAVQEQIAKDLQEMEAIKETDVYRDEVLRSRGVVPPHTPNSSG